MGIGLEGNYKAKMVEKLNPYLSNVQIMYMNVRGYHWNIVGRKFFSLHEKFEEIYDDLNDMADEIAERILMLDGNPLHSFTDYIKVATIKERMDVSSTQDTTRAFLDDMAVLLANEREILSLAGDNDDEGTSALMSDYIGEQEKLMWMFNAFLE